jgi:hypothetical protein
VSGYTIKALVGLIALAGAAPQSHARLFFYNPSRTIECRFSFGTVGCAGFRRSQMVVLNDTGPSTVTITGGFGTRAPECRKPPGDYPQCWFERGGKGPTLAVGATAIDPDVHSYRCESLATAISCWSTVTGRGFRISDAGVVAIRMKR